MFETQLIQRLIVLSVYPFGYEEFDFRDPESGETLRRVCLHGPNGCGKSTLLRCLRGVLDPSLPLLPEGVSAGASGGGGVVVAELSSGEESRWLARGLQGSDAAGEGHHWFREGLDGAEGWERLAEGAWDLARFVEAFEEWRLSDEVASPSAPAESEVLGADAHWGGKEDRGGRGTDGDLAEAAALEQIVARARRDREQAFLSYLSHPQSQERSVAEVRERFDELAPDPVEAVRCFWEETMSQSGLSLITEPLLGFQSSRAGGPVPIASVSPALRRFLLSALVGRLGSSGERGRRFLFVDSPEGGLGGDLPSRLAGFLLESGRQRGIQAFFSTLAPEVAGLFSEHEVVHLGFEEGRSGMVRSIQSTRRSGSLGADDEGGAGGEDEPGPEEGADDEGREPAIEPGFASLSSLKRAIQETEDQGELADLIDRLVSMRGR